MQTNRQRCPHPCELMWWRQVCEVCFSESASDCEDADVGAADLLPLSPQRFTDTLHFYFCATRCKLGGNWSLNITSVTLTLPRTSADVIDGARIVFYRTENNCQGLASLHSYMLHHKTEWKQFYEAFFCQREVFNSHTFVVHLAKNDQLHFSIFDFVHTQNKLVQTWKSCF